MEPNPYEAPGEVKNRQSNLGLFLRVPWFWLALLLLAIAVMATNQFGVMRVMSNP